MAEKTIPSLTTLWDKAQQVIRKGLGYGAGYLVGRGFIDDEMSLMLIALAMAAVDWIWFTYFARYDMATVAGIEKAAADPASPITATTVAQVVKAKA